MARCVGSQNFILSGKIKPDFHTNKASFFSGDGVVGCQSPKIRYRKQASQRPSLSRKLRPSEPTFCVVVVFVVVVLLLVVHFLMTLYCPGNNTTWPLFFHYCFCAWCLLAFASHNDCLDE